VVEGAVLHGHDDDVVDTGFLGRRKPVAPRATRPRRPETGGSERDAGSAREKSAAGDRVQLLRVLSSERRDSAT
jgi:hypothetical protein